MVRAIEDARAACDRYRWGDAWRLLGGLEAGGLDIDDLDRLATAAYLTGRDEEAFAHWTRAHQVCAGAGLPLQAARFGMRLAQGLGFKGDLARCRGWVDRTARLLDEAGIDCVEQGYLEHALGLGRLFDAGDVAGAHDHFTRAGRIAARFSHPELVVLARIGEGRMRIYLGDVGGGMALLDEAMVAVEADELSPLEAGNAYCTVIDACSELFDVDRWRSWTDSFERWCETQQELVLYRGHCFLHRAEIRGLLGAWPEALDEARHACDHLAAPVNPAALAAAHALEGDLLRLLLDFDGAEACYRRASEHGKDPQPGLALLRLAQGRIDVAGATIRRVLGETEDPIARLRVLDAYVEIVLATGDTAAARSAAAELDAAAATFGTSLLRAQAGRATGAVLLAEGDARDALVALRRAFNDFHALGARYDAARTRILVGDACRALGDDEAAGMESTAGHRTLESLRGTAPRAGTTADGLTGRELEVLVLLAGGRTNRVIAQELVISEKTVATHVSHIFTKLGVTSRSAATAYAYDHRLVPSARAQ